MSKRTILIVNDDGIKASGIKLLAEKAKKYGEVYVIAPDTQRSAKSHSITYSDYIEVVQEPAYLDGVEAYACSGSPADCVRVGIKVIGRKPDVVLSGVNKGYNISYDIQYSATVGAALEAAFLGIPAIALMQPIYFCRYNKKYTIT